MKNEPTKPTAAEPLFFGAVELSRVQLQNAAYFIPATNGRQHNDIFTASEALIITWHVESGLIELLNQRDHVFIPMSAVVSFKLKA